MNIILFDTEARKKLFPLTLTRATASIRMGILTNKERWEKLTSAPVYVLTEEYLQSLYESVPAGEFVFLDASVIPTKDVIKTALNLRVGEGFADEAGLIGGRAAMDNLPHTHNLIQIFDSLCRVSTVRRLQWLHQMFQWNDELLRFDFELLTKGRPSNPTNESVHLVNASKIFVEEGASVDHCHLNASTGPIYIGNNATIMEGCFVRGPFALGEGAVLKMGAKVYGATTIGPFCTAGGEIKNSILTAFSNKAHDGYLGDSVIGEWCNMGAGTSNSNVKNTGGEVQLWNQDLQQFMPAGNKCGVIMGDYSRTAINSSINTGTVIGICSNVFGAGLLPRVIPGFSWGADGQKRYDFHKAQRDINNWKKMKNKVLSASETRVLKHIFEHFNDNHQQ